MRGSELVAEMPCVAFLRAIADENLEEIRALVARDAGLLSAVLRDGLLALHMAAGAGKEMVVDELLALGAESNLLDQTGKRPLHYASSAQIAELLLAAGADANGRDTMHARTPLHTVNSRKVAMVLVSAGADVDASDDNQRTPLHHAAADGNLRMVRFLLSRKADPNVVDYQQQTPLHLAEAHGHAEVVALLAPLTPPPVARKEATRATVMESILASPAREPAAVETPPEILPYHEDEILEVDVPRDYAQQIGQLANEYRGIASAGSNAPATAPVSGRQTGALVSDIWGARSALLIGLVIGLLPAVIFAILYFNRASNTPHVTTTSVLAEERFVHPIPNLSLAQVKTELPTTLDYHVPRDLSDMSTVLEQGVADLTQHNIHVLLNIYRSGQQENQIYGLEFMVDAEAQAGLETPSSLDNLAIGAFSSVLAISRFSSDRETIKSWLNDTLPDCHAAAATHAITLHGLRFACYGSPWTRTLEITAN